MDAETTDSDGFGCLHVIRYIFPILLIVGILLLVFDYVIFALPPSPEVLPPNSVVEKGEEPTGTGVAETAESASAQKSTATPTTVVQDTSPTSTPDIEATVNALSAAAATQAAVITAEAIAALTAAVPTPTSAPMSTATPVSEAETPPSLPQTGGVLAQAPSSLPTVYAQASWPEAIRFEDSDIVDLLLTTVKTKPVSTVTVTTTGQTESRSILPMSTPFPRVMATSQAIDFAEACNLNIPADYQGFAIASLDGSAFDISPQGPQREALNKLTTAHSTISWAWTITAKRAGSHKLNLNLEVEWIPIGNIPAPTIQCDIWEDQVLGITVKGPPFFTIGQISIGGIGLMIIGGIGTVFQNMITGWIEDREKKK
jgi:hypothetical protein